MRMSRPPHLGETFSPPEPVTRQHDARSGPNGGSSVPEALENHHPIDNPDETRPRSSFGLAGSGPAGGFEPNPVPPSLLPPGNSPLAGDQSDGDGFGETTAFGQPSLHTPGNAPSGGLAEPDGFGPPIEYAGPPIEYAGPPTEFSPPPGEFTPPGDFRSAQTEFASPPGGGFGPPPPGFGPAQGSFNPTLEGFNASTDGAPPGGPSGAMGGLRPSQVDGPGSPLGAGPRSGAPTGASGARARGPRRARLQLRHINPWTVLKFSCVLSIALFFVWLITIGLLYGILQAAGVIDQINNAATTINGSGSKDPVTPGLVFGGAAIIGVVNIVLFIALSTVGSVVYNLCADLVGGVEVTLSERD